LISTLIKLWTFGKYSHCEIRIGDCSYDANASAGMIIARSGGWPEDKWDVYDIELSPDSLVKMRTFLMDKIGKSYDYRGIFLSQIFPFDRHDKNGWFCSELCYAALSEAQLLDGERKAHRVHPNLLHKLIVKKGHKRLH
jgi:hypothetical protein